MNNKNEHIFPINTKQSIWLGTKKKYWGLFWTAEAVWLLFYFIQPCKEEENGRK